MRVRKRHLPLGWYPGSAGQVREAIAGMLPKAGAESPGCIAGVAPHAGWEFSGALALEVFSRITPSIGTLVIIGGHLGPADGILCAFEDAFETPLGEVQADLELLAGLRSRLRMREDAYADNTVEIQLPFVKYLFPDARVLGMRAAPSEEAVELGQALAGLRMEGGKGIAVVGSTDLTHYGDNYGFSPVGRGKKALEWVREVNDRRFIACMTGIDAAGAIKLAREERSACSAGGAIAAMSFAKSLWCTTGTLVKYATSHDVYPSESFVGYAGVTYSLTGG
jgi:AmmeMemoRadiSam system protein B